MECSPAGLECLNRRLVLAHRLPHPPGGGGWNRTSAFKERKDLGLLVRFAFSHKETMVLFCFLHPCLFPGKKQNLLNDLKLALGTFETPLHPDDFPRIHGLLAPAPSTGSHGTHQVGTIWSLPHGEARDQRCGPCSLPGAWDLKEGISPSLWSFGIENCCSTLRAQLRGPCFVMLKKPEKQEANLVNSRGYRPWFLPNLHRKRVKFPVAPKHPKQLFHSDRRAHPHTTRGCTCFGWKICLTRKKQQLFSNYGRTCRTGAIWVVHFASPSLWGVWSLDRSLHYLHRSGCSPRCFSSPSTRSETWSPRGRCSLISSRWVVCFGLVAGDVGSTKSLFWRFLLGVRYISY